MSTTEQSKRQHSGEFIGTIIEILKWGLVLFCLWPMVTLQYGKFSLVRVLTGIVLFIIFSGKLLYDYLIRDIVRQRSVSRKRDIITFIGIIVGASLIVGLVLFFFSIFIIRFMAETKPY